MFFVRLEIIINGAIKIKRRDMTHTIVLLSSGLLGFILVILLDKIGLIK